MSERSTQEPRGVVASLEAAAKYLRERFGHTNIVADDCERAVRAIRAMGAENASLHENVAALLSRIAELEKDRERLDVLSGLVDEARVSLRVGGGCCGCSPGVTGHGGFTSYGED